MLRANKESSELGGHIASFQSAATLYDVGFMHFWRGATPEHGGDLVYMQGHSSPGFYARAFLEGRITEEQMLRFRQEVDGKPGTTIAAHSHEAFAEAHYVIEGDLINDGEEFGPGGYITHGPGAVHGPHPSKGGCRVLTIQTGHPGPEQADHRVVGGAGQGSS